MVHQIEIVGGPRDGALVPFQGLEMHEATPRAHLRRGEDRPVRVLDCYWYDLVARAGGRRVYVPRGLRESLTARH